MILKEKFRKPSRRVKSESKVGELESWRVKPESWRVGELFGYIRTFNPKFIVILFFKLKPCFFSID